MSHVDLIWGPPGTGKTSTISTLLFMLLKRNCRTLICAPTNVAITQVASRVIRLVHESYKDESFKKYMVCPLGDVFLFAKNDRLQLDRGFEEICLDRRIDSLVECLGRDRGWRRFIHSTIHFFKHSVSDYETYRKTELIKRSDSAKPIMSFAEFIKSRFEVAVSPVRRCMITMCNHIPRHFIQEHNFQNMISLISLLDDLKETLYQKHMTSNEELKKIFSQPVTSEVSCQSFLDTSSLVYLRTQCLTILKTLLRSFRKINLPSGLNRAAIKEFCLRCSSLVFCTSSSSYKMHSLYTKPFKVLVIDEVDGM
ncbi:hypothetical protein DM860_005735 [Cuscuta australis]|uniref:DNA2/NAM7 helicase helicase domain-containing protein n=1 Tax=Cuscuta australis TaxID=267555 RepID=A0A328DVV3_9ASTE|nr:hypothetical protein DM860_005735 [Cuscuta australis]